MATKTTAKKKSGTKSRSAGKDATRAVRKTAKTARTTVRKAAKSPVSKVAAKVLAGAAAGAVRAIIPQLEEAAGTQEKIAGGDTSRKSAAGSRAKRGSRA